MNNISKTSSREYPNLAFCLFVCLFSKDQSQMHILIRVFSFSFQKNKIPILWFAIDHPQEDFAKFGYMSERKSVQKNKLGFLLCFGDMLKLIV
jgi:hypothetical protein